MPFWSTEKIKERSKVGKIVDPFPEAWINHGAVHLSIGNEICMTSNEPSTKKQVLKENESFNLMPGQFGLLLTHESVSIPTDAIGFISIRAGIKFKGLVNISGFHIDPGFIGKLKFSIFNAGSRPITLTQGERIFMLWLSDLDRDTQDGRKGQKEGQDFITSEDQSRMQDKVASPAALKEQMEALERKHDQRLIALEKETALWRGITIAIGLAVISLVAGGGLLRIFETRGTANSAPSSGTYPPKIDPGKK